MPPDLSGRLGMASARTDRRVSWTDSEFVCMIERPLRCATGLAALLKSSGRTLMPFTRLWLLAAVTTALACSNRERADQHSAADSVFTPTQYSVADLYRNTEYAGASLSAAADRILVSSNQSGVYNAYAIPVAGGEPEPLTHSTDNVLLPGRRPHPLLQRQGRQRAGPPLRPQRRWQDQGPDAGSQAQGGVRGVVRGRPLVFRPDQRTR